ncbi:MAG: hypothetical protein LQ351_000047 [Letrouitia transgressa]|nr:MAG: hypothetical protein LQ351_000047 [Letrouitia transgressa]
MAKLPRPEKPLKILTIDGGGLQGISTLLILDKLLNAIARSNSVLNSKPRPCDVFDVIAGIGAGGWIALLLGRFQLDVPAALAEWYNLIDCIAPRSKAEELRMRLMQHSYFDTERLVEQIDRLTEFYDTDKHMFFTPPDSTRCKHVFVSALKTDSKETNLGYNLFRTYDCPEGAKVLDGLCDPRAFKISHAFGVTGAAKHFTPPWKKGKFKFLDVKFPSPHNITELALDEVWGLYGTDVEISVVVNIGPGIPSAYDYQKIARRFSWGREAFTTTSSKRKRFSGAFGASDAHHNISKFKRRRSDLYEPMKDVAGEINGTSRVKFDGNLPVLENDAEKKQKEIFVSRHTTFGSERNVGIAEKLKRDEDKIEDDIRHKLKNVYQKDDRPPYYRLAPEKSAPGTVQNDTSSPKTSFDATTQYLDTRQVRDIMDEVSHRIPVQTPVLAM